MPRKSKDLPRTKPRIQEPAEDKAEKKIRTDASKKTEILQSFILLNSFPYRNPPYSKNVGRRYSPQGGFNPPPNRGRRAGRSGRGLLALSGVLPKPIFQSQGSQSLSPAFPFLNPPPPGPGRLHLLRRFAALARLGAS